MPNPHCPQILSPGLISGVASGFFGAGRLAGAAPGLTAPGCTAPGCTAPAGWRPDWTGPASVGEDAGGDATTSGDPSIGGATNPGRAASVFDSANCEREGSLGSAAPGDGRTEPGRTAPGSEGPGTPGTTGAGAEVVALASAPARPTCSAGTRASCVSPRSPWSAVGGTDSPPAAGRFDTVTSCSEPPADDASMSVPAGSGPPPTIVAFPVNRGGGGGT